MNSIAFLYAIIILCIIQAACFVFTVNLHTWLGKYTIGDLSRLYIPTSVELMESAFLALFLLGVTGFVTFVGNSLFIQKKNSNKNGAFNKFYLPIIEELLKFGLVFFIAHRSGGSVRSSEINKDVRGDADEPHDISHISVKQVAIIVLVFNLVKFFLFVYRFSPMNYEKVYKEFINFHRMWREHITIDNTLRNNKKSRVDAAMMLAESLGDDKRSIYSRKSIATLINPAEAISMPLRVPSFDRVSLGIKKASSIKSDMISVDLESCYNLVDKLYSISPKNTYHLDTDDVVQVSIDDLEDDEDPPTLESNLSDKPLRSDIEQNCLLYDVGKDENNYIQNSNSRLEKHSYFIPNNGNKQYDTTPNCMSVFISCINSFAWLLPFQPIPQESEELNKDTRPLTKNRNFDPAIKNKLSSYQLNENATDSETLHSSEALLSQYSLPRLTYGALDLESQTSMDTSICSVCLNERNNIKEFQLFVENYFDYTYDTFQISVDPIFETFGITIFEFNTKLFIVFFSCNYVWNLSTFLIYAYPFFNNSFLHFYFIIITILIIKLFNRNFLHDKHFKKSVKFSLIVELLINVSIFVGTTLLFRLGINNT
ncbi:unnamed protein product [Debaryomyces fabryi]|nr:unnamed protein product [Debaryomyces fabryi]